MDWGLLFMAIPLTALVVLIAVGPPPTPPAQECPADEFLPPCQTRAFFQYRAARTYTTTSWPDDDDHNTTLCWMYLEEIKRGKDEADHQQYLGTIEETIRGLEARVEALEKWRKAVVDEQGPRVVPVTGEAFVGQRASTMKIGDVIGHSIWPDGIPIPRDFTLNPVPPNICRCSEAKVNPRCEQWGCYMY